jgi:hypothetical protein
MKKVKLFEEFIVESQARMYESKMGDIYVMAGDADSFTAFRKEFMDEYGKPKTVKELKALEAWLQTIWKEVETNEALSMDAVYIHQITGSGQDSAQNFIDDNNIDSAKLVAYLKQHKDSKEKYDVRDMINGTNKNKRFIKQFVNESKEVFPNEIVGNDQILFKKEWEKMNGGKLAAKYNQYYRGYDIDAGGHIFGSVAELERFMKNYILSNNLYNKYKYMPEIPIAESVDINEKVDMELLKFEMDKLKKENPGKRITYIFTQDGKKGYRLFINGKLVAESVVNEEFDISKLKAKDTIELTNTRTGDVGKYTVKRIFGGSSDIKEIEVLTRNKQLLTLYYSKERGLQNFKGDVYEYMSESKLGESVVNEDVPYSVTKNTYRDYDSLNITQYDSIQFKEDGNKWIVRAVTAHDNIDKSALQKLGFGNSGSTRYAGINTYTKNANWNDLELTKKQFDELVKIVDAGWASHAKAFADFYKNRQAD